VLCPGEESEIVVAPLQWENVKYSLNKETDEIHEVTEGLFIQYPIRLAWAITIHKSQGLTFEHAIIDAQASFAHGQVYVALSRCKTLEGMVLSTPIKQHSIINDRKVSGFTQQIEQNQPDETRFNSARIAYQHELLTDLFRFLSLRSRILYIEKIIKENASSIPVFVRDLFRRMLPSVQTEIIEVSDRFHTQINRLLQQQPDVEQNPVLQERIGQAAGYFSEKIKTHILDVISKVDLDIDNKAAKKQLDDAATRLEEETRIKQQCLIACRSGFHLTSLLQAKAVATIEKAKPKENRKFTALDNEDISHPILFNHLRSWRIAKATDLGVPAFGVFSQKTLFELVNYLPTDEKRLMQINGIGQKKASQFGMEIIEIIRKYCDEAGVEQPEIPSKAAKAESKPPKTDTKLLSFNLFKEGKSIAEIAESRQLTPNTIEGHLAYYVSQGEIDVLQLISSDKLDKITDYFKKSGINNLATAKEALGSEISYGELHLALAHFKIRNTE
jgi:hypothetical protein